MLLDELYAQQRYKSSTPSPAFLFTFLTPMLLNGFGDSEARNHTVMTIQKE